MKAEVFVEGGRLFIKQLRQHGQRKAVHLIVLDVEGAEDLLDELHEKMQELPCVVGKIGGVPDLAQLMVDA